MARQQETPERDREGVVQLIGEISEKSQRLLHNLAEREYANGGKGTADPLNLGSTIFELTARMMTRPATMMQAQLSLWQDYLRLWQATSQQLLGQRAAPVIEPERGDRRFRAPDWDDYAVFDFIKQSYLLTSRWLVNTVRELDGLDAKTRQKVDFYTRQFVDALAPSEFRRSPTRRCCARPSESGGQNLLHGLNNLLDDLDRGNGQLRDQDDRSEAFELGGNIAAHARARSSSRTT